MGVGSVAGSGRAAGLNRPSGLLCLLRRGWLNRRLRRGRRSGLLWLRGGLNRLGGRFRRGRGRGLLRRLGRGRLFAGTARRQNRERDGQQNDG